MANLVVLAESQVRSHVVDKTGLTGTYDFILDFARNGLVALAIAKPDGQEESGPDFFTALQAQLGLKLEPRRVPVDVLVIDHINKEVTGN